MTFLQHWITLSGEPARVSFISPRGRRWTATLQDIIPVGMTLMTEQS
jgi:hypothetical protein